MIYEVGLGLPSSFLAFLVQEIQPRILSEGVVIRHPAMLQESTMPLLLAHQRLKEAIIPTLCVGKLRPEAWLGS